MTNDANQKTYFSTIDKVEQNQVLKEVYDEKISVYIWEDGQEEEELQELKLHSHNINEEKICLETVGKIFGRLLGTDLSGKSIYLKLTFQKIQYFTHGELSLDKDSGLYYFNPKHAFYKGQKRTNYRLLSDSQRRIQLKLKESVYECFDISASGISIMLPDAAKDTFKVDMVFNNSTIRLDKQDFLISKIKIMGLFNKEQRPEVKPGFIQVGMAFTKLDRAIEEKLFLAINSEARSAEMRKKFVKKGN